jgi:arylsulfatase A-like enzyme
MSSRPNLLLLCPDELKASALGLYGQTLPVSPFLDAVAPRAAVFEQCHTVHPKCVPSRAALLTGQYPHVGGHRTLELLVQPHELNLVRTLRQAGYVTALFGKNHVVDAATFPETFDVWSPDGGRYTLEQPGETRTVPPGSFWVGEDPVPLSGWRDRLNTENALAWLTQDRPRDRPFFAWLNWDSPHPPYKVPAPFYGSTDRARVQLPPEDIPHAQPAYKQELRAAYGLDAMSDSAWREVVATYLDMCRFIDAEIERVIGQMEKAGLLQDTVVAIWSDHGDFAGEHALVEKWDTAFHDCITRVPLVLYAPGRIRPLRSSAMVESIDLLPTLLELAGVSVPKGVQGRSLGRVLAGETVEHRDGVLCQGGQECELLDRVTAPDARPRPCAAYQMKQAALFSRPIINARAKMYRDRHWKYVFRLGDVEELYDLQSDPAELRNLAVDPDHAETLQVYRQKLLTRLVEAETVEPYQGFLEA